MSTTVYPIFFEITINDRYQYGRVSFYSGGYIEVIKNRREKITKVLNLKYYG
jgi:hypothetical protein